MAESFEALDFHEFHRSELPRRMAKGYGALAAPGAEPLGALAFHIAESGAAYTYRAREGSIEVISGDADAQTVVELAHASWQGLVHDLESAPGLLYGGLAKGRRGDLMEFVRWEPALRALYQGRPIYDPETVDLRDRHGHVLDPDRAFDLDCADEVAARDCRRAGVLGSSGLGIARALLPGASPGAARRRGGAG